MKDIVIFDLDGTLANTAECRHFLEGETKDWDGFYRAACKVSAIDSVLRTLFQLQGNFKIYIVSGRSDIVRNETEVWLSNHNIIQDVLIMRRAGDHTPDDVLKKSWVESGLIEKGRVLCAFDDRNRVVKMWRDIGIPCFQVAEGDF